MIVECKQGSYSSSRYFSYRHVCLLWTEVNCVSYLTGFTHTLQFFNWEARGPALINTLLLPISKENWMFVASMVKRFKPLRNVRIDWQKLQCSFVALFFLFLWNAVDAASVKASWLIYCAKTLLFFSVLHNFHTNYAKLTHSISLCSIANVNLIEARAPK